MGGVAPGGGSLREGGLGGALWEEWHLVEGQ